MVLEAVLLAVRCQSSKSSYLCYCYIHQPNKDGCILRMGMMGSVYGLLAMKLIEVSKTKLDVSCFDY